MCVCVVRESMGLETLKRLHLDCFQHLKWERVRERMSK